MCGGRFHFEEVKCPIRNECHLPGLFANPNLTRPCRSGVNVLRLVIERYKVDDIAQLLHISPHTVTNHIRNIHEKLLHGQSQIW